MRRVRLLLPTLAILASILTPIFIFNLIYSGKIFPNTFIAGVDVSGKNVNEAETTITENIKLQEKITLSGQGQNLTIDPKDIDLAYDFPDSVNRAFNFTRTGNLPLDLFVRTDLLFHPKNIGLTTKINDDKLGSIISVVSGQNSIEPIFPTIKAVSGKVQVNKGAKGTEVDQKLLRANIGEHLSMAKTDNINVPVRTVDPSLNDDEASAAQSRAEKYIGKSVQIKFEFSEYNLKDSEILSFLNPKSGFNFDKINAKVVKIAQDVERDPQNPKFDFNGGRVTEFQPALDGVKVQTEKFQEKLDQSLNLLETEEDKLISFEIPVIRTQPEVQTGSVNSLGIKELIGRGTSTFFHSIPSRVHNVLTATARINGSLIKPGDTFSFNDTLGDVSQFTGYQQAYIISGGKTILGDGGGVCQVSTTLFRSILNAGLPITERQAHAYRVGYYEQNSPPGLDATVYSPSPDLKFKNDTGNYILIVAKADAKRYSLVFELYGTSDGRVSTVSKPVVTNIVPAPEDLYQDDPSLPAGTIKQVDFKAAGAHVTFNYSVNRGEETIYKRTFISNYRPWQAIYLRGTGPTN